MARQTNHIQASSISVLISLLAVSLAPCIGPATSEIPSATYYVANNGDDDDTGTSPSSPWQTVARVNTASLEPGDRVLFRRGDEWYEALTITTSGEAGKPILFGAYGTGPRPRILGSIRLTEWSHVSGNIWVSSEATSDPSLGAPHDGSQSGSGGYPGGAWFEELDGAVTWGHQEAYIDYAGDDAELAEPYDWGWHDGHIYLYAPTDPTAEYAGVHVAQRQYAIGMPGNNPQEHIIIDGLEMSFTQSKGFYGGYPAREAHNLTIRNCKVGYVGIKGAASAYGLAVWHSDLLVQGNEIHDCGRRSVSYNVYATRNVVFENATFEHNHFHHGYHTTGLDISNSGTDHMRHFVVRNNLFEGDPDVDLGGPEAFNSNHIWTHTNPSGQLSDFTFVNNVFTYCHGKGLTVNGISDVLVAFNTFYGVNPTLANYQAQLYFSNAVGNVVVRNNIFVNTVDPSLNPYFFCVKADSDQIDDIDMDRNLYFTTDSEAAIIDIVGVTGVYQMSEWNDYRLDTGWDSSSPPPQNPQLVDGHAGDLHLGPTSPAIGAGDPVPGVITDFEGMTRSQPPSLGAYGYRSTGGLSADLSIEVSDGSDPVAAGTDLVYTIVVTNSGPDPAEAVTISEILAGSAVFVASSGCNEDPHGVPDCSLGWVPAHTQTSATVTLHLDESTTGLVTNEASVSSLSIEANPGDETDAETTIVVPVDPGDSNADLELDAADLALTIAVLDDQALVLQGDPDCTRDGHLLPNDLGCVAATIHDDGG